MTVLAFLIRLVVRTWLATLRLRRVGPPFHRPSVIVFWHGDQLPLLAVRPRSPVAAPVSLSRDGSLQAAVLAGLGITCVRGSTSRAGARAALGLLRRLDRGWPVLVAVDGPRGPRGQVAPGAAFIARRAGVAVFAVGVAVGRGHRLRRSWDRFLLPMPFTRTVVFVSEPLTPGATEDDTTFAERVGAELRRATSRAREAVGRGPVPHGRDREGGVT